MTACQAILGLDDYIVEAESANQPGDGGPQGTTDAMLPPQGGTCQGTPLGCSDSIACTVGDRCDEANDECVAGSGSCPNAGEVCSAATGACMVDCSGCTIQNTCYADDAVNSLNPCEVCDVSTADDAWTPAPASTTCDDRLGCTMGDACVAGRCEGTPLACDDDSYCNGVAVCVEPSGSCQPGASPCTVSESCIESDNSCAPICNGPILGCACTVAGGLACNGSAQKLTLLCNNGIYVSNGTCASDENCSQPTGVCTPIVDACQGHTGGDTVCVGGDVHECGPDLVTSALEETCDLHCEDRADGARCVSVVQVAAGYLHTCVLFSTGNMRCWGDGGLADGGLGQLGYGNTRNVGDGVGLSVAAVGNIDLGQGATAAQIAVGDFHTCALVSSDQFTGGVRCWGYGGLGQLGYGNVGNVGDGLGPSVAAVGNIDLGPGVTATQITAGGSHTCALLSTGGVRCWGYGGDGQLGYGDTANVGDGVGQSVAEVGNVIGVTASQVSAAGNHTCALSSEGVRCWGDGSFGALGYGNTANVGDGIGQSVAEVGNVIGVTASQVVAAGNHTCALSSEGVRCWGYGPDGRLGYGNTVPQSVAAVGNVNLGFEVTAAQITARNPHTCALLSSGGVRCWGDGSFGALGYGNTANVGDGVGASVAAVGNVNFGQGVTAMQISAGSYHTCALVSTGGVRCWGYGIAGQLGYGNTSSVGDGLGPSVADVGDIQFF